MLLVTAFNLLSLVDAKVRVEVMLMCKYNLFVALCKSECGELCVPKGVVWGSVCSIYCA